MAKIIENPLVGGIDLHLSTTDSKPLEPTILSPVSLDLSDRYSNRGPIPSKSKGLGRRTSRHIPTVGEATWTRPHHLDTLRLVG